MSELINRNPFLYEIAGLEDLIHFRNIEVTFLFFITKICVKLGFTGVYNIFLISAQKNRLWVLLEPVLTSTYNLYFEQKYGEYEKFFI